MPFWVTSFLLLVWASAVWADEGIGRQNLEKTAIRAYAAQEFTTALAAYEKIAALEPTSWNFERAAEVAASGSRWADARRLYKRALREALRAQSSETAVRLRRRIQDLPVEPDRIARLIAEERFDEAFKLLKEYLNLNAGDVWAMTLLGFVYEEIGQDKQAERLYLQALKLAPNYPAPHYYYGRFLLLKVKKFEQALEELKRFRECLKSAPGQTAVEKRRLAEEKTQATRWIASILDTVLQKPDQAFREIESLIRSVEPKADLLYDYGVLAARLGRKRTAFDAFQKVIARAPDSDLALHARQAIEVVRNTGADGNSYADPYS